MTDETRVRCNICPYFCNIKEGNFGICGARTNKNGEIVADNYGKITSIALDPIEKKPLRRFHPGSNILSVGSYGCNFRCSFCQNWSISMEGKNRDYIYLSPADLVKKAKEYVPRGNIGIAYTYNEPLIGYEYVMDCTKLIVENGLKNVVVTNGFINREPFEELLPYIHAFNIDLKSFSQEFYKNIGGDLEVVKRSIELASKKCHVEVTTLIIPGENDSEDEMRELTKWLASIDRKIPLHISRFFPAYKMPDKSPTPISTILKLTEIASESLDYVYAGNV